MADPKARYGEEEDRTAIVNVAELRRAAAAVTPKDRRLLVRVDRSHVGQVFQLSEQEVTLGRQTGVDLWLTDDGISRRHARIFWEEGGHVLEDLGSANGTFVAGRKIERHRLSDGDVMQFGPSVVFRYAVTDGEQEDMLRHLYEASVRDALTGAYNRDHFEERLRGEVAYARRHGAECSLVMFDLDHFKKVNDTYGHQGGDAALLAVAAKIRTCLRTEDVFARYGGEEFAVIFRGIDVSGVGRVGERLRQTVAALPVAFDRRPIVVTMSVGCASLAECTEKTPEALVAAADRRLYAAKRSGRNKVVSSG